MTERTDGRTDVRRILRGVAHAFDEAEARGFARGVATAAASVEDEARKRGGYFAQVAVALVEIIREIKSPV